MRVVAIIQARMGSSRFPGKVLAPLGHQPVLDWVVQGAAAISGVDQVVVATSQEAQDDPIAEWCEGSRTRCHRGPEEDVLERFLLAAKAEKADIILRITADCPLIDPDVCAMVLSRLRLSGADYATNFEPRSWPDGLDCEAFTFAALELAAANAVKPAEREHVTPFMRNHRRRLALVSVPCPIPGLETLRWTCDTPEDLDHLRTIVSTFAVDHRPSWIEILQATQPENDKLGDRARAKPAAAKPGGRYAISHQLFEHASRVIPLGSQTFSKSHLQFPHQASPLFLSHGDGGRVWDADGNEYVDLIGGLLPVVLGYRDQDVDRAIAKQMVNGISFSLSTELELELAELLIDIIPCAEMVRFGKNGSDATSAAIRIARAATGRDRVAICGYHGWQDWYVAVTTRNKGVPASVSELSDTFSFNDIDSLDALLGRHTGEFAAVILEPAGFEEPAPGYLESVLDLAHRHGALLVFDEIITGFRFHLGGAQSLYGVTPDLACFGKAMANGMPISAIVGRRDLMGEMEEVFLSATFGGETLSLAAAIAVIGKMQREPVIERLWQTGGRIAEGVNALIVQHEISGSIALGGLPPWQILAFKDQPGASAQAVKTLFLREMLERGILLNASHNVSYAHDDSDINAILQAYGDTLPVVAEAVARGTLEAELGNTVIKPVFSVR